MIGKTLFTYIALRFTKSLIAMMLLLLFLFFGVMALQQAMETEEAGHKASAILALVGLVNIPIIKYSVEWWNTLHQPASFTITERPAMPLEMWMPLLIMVLGFYAFFAAFTLTRTRTEILRREGHKRWVKELFEERP